MGMFRIAVPPAVERTALIVSVALLAAGAWLALWLGENSASAFLNHQHHLGHLGTPSALFIPPCTDRFPVLRIVPPAFCGRFHTSLVFAKRLHASAVKAGASLQRYRRAGY